MPDLPESPDGAVVRSLAAASRRLCQGDHVVLLVAPDAGHVARPACGGGRLAVLVGDPEDAVVLAAAAAMSGELFGSPGASSTSELERAEYAPRSIRE